MCPCANKERPAENKSLNHRKFNIVTQLNYIERSDSLMDLKLRMKNEQQNPEEEGEPVSPGTQPFSTSILSLAINMVFEFQRPVLNIKETIKKLTDNLIPKNPRFGCILEIDDKGVPRWKKTSVNLDDHLFTPLFPPGSESYDMMVSDYISNLCLRPFDQSRPLFEFHLLNYRTARAESTLIIRAHHALGDGISFMSIVYSCFTRADDPTLPLTFPFPKKPNHNITPKGVLSTRNCVGKIWYLILVLWYTMADVMNCLLRMMGWLEDSQMPIRGPPGVEFLPMTVSSVEFPIKDIKRIKASIGGTVNDVLTGIIFCGVQRYLQISLSAAAGGEQSLQHFNEKRFNLNDILTKQMKKLRVTALSLINKRILTGVENVEEMLQPNAQIPWGNHFGFLYLQIPLGIIEKPLEFVKIARNIIKKHKISMGVIASTYILGLIGRFRRPQALAKYAYNTIASTTMTISNMIGPIEKIVLNENIVERLSFFVSGPPQALNVYILSYMDTMTIQVVSQKDYINSNILSSIFKETFEEIKVA